MLTRCSAATDVAGEDIVRLVILDGTVARVELRRG